MAKKKNTNKDSIINAQETPVQESAPDNHVEATVAQEADTGTTQAPDERLANDGREGQPEAKEEPVLTVESLDSNTLGKRDHGTAAGLSFGQALEALKQGRKVTREQVLRAGMFITIDKGDVLNAPAAYLHGPTAMALYNLSIQDILAEDWVILE